MKYDAILILGHELDEKKELSPINKERMNLGIKLIKEGIANYFIVSGGHKDIGEKYGISISKAMKKYAMNSNIEKNKIIEEDISLETVGELIFVKQGIVLPRKWNNILIITHDWHMERTKKESKFIFGKNYHLGFQPVKNSIFPSRTKEQEEKSYQSFLKTFEKIKSGEDEKILKTLFEKHPAYIPYSKKMEKGLKKIIQKNENK